MTATGKKKNISIEKRRERTAYLFIAPAAILIIAFCIIPLIASFYISTQKMGVIYQLPSLLDSIIIKRLSVTDVSGRALALH